MGVWHEHRPKTRHRPGRPATGAVRDPGLGPARAPARDKGGRPDPGPGQGRMKIYGRTPAQDKKDAERRTWPHITRIFSATVFRKIRGLICDCDGRRILNFTSRILMAHRPVMCEVASGCGLLRWASQARTFGSSSTTHGQRCSQGLRPGWPTEATCGPTRARFRTLSCSLEPKSLPEAAVVGKPLRCLFKHKLEDAFVLDEPIYPGRTYPVTW